MTPILTSLTPAVAIGAVAIGLLSAAPAMANGPHDVPVRTHSSQGEVRDVDGASARLTRLPAGVVVEVDTVGLTPGHAHTLWLVAINAPEHCESEPCASADVMGATDRVEADLGFGDGAVAGADGRARFVAHQPVGAMQSAWFGHGLKDTGAEIHAVIRDHGPIMADDPASLLTTFRGGCAEPSVPETLPETARGDGAPGDHACANVQAAIFAPAN